MVRGRGASTAPELGKHFGFKYSCKLELSVACRGLVNLDLVSKSDPQVVLYSFNAASGLWLETGRTEMIRDDLNPTFMTPFIVNYKFEEDQPLRFVVYDIDNSGALTEQDLVGELQLSLAQIVASPTQSVTKEILYLSRNKRRAKKASQARGEMTVSYEEIREVNGQCVSLGMQLACDELEIPRSLGSSSVFLMLSRIPENKRQRNTPVYRTECRGASRPNFKAFNITLERLCRNDPKSPFIVEVYKWRGAKDPLLLGGAQASVAQLMGGAKALPLRPPNKAEKAKPVGRLLIRRFSESLEPTFLDYIKGNCNIQLITAIDFTASNKQPDLPGSLHYWNTDSPNPYAKAIMSAGRILAHYDSDNLFPVYGFGAKVPPNYSVNHCFPLTFSEEDVSVEGLDGVLDVYQYALDKIIFSGPTVLSEVINKAAQEAAAKPVTQEEQNYYLLLIITDGSVSLDDMPATIDAIIAASDLPLSIVIIGLGKADFSYMHYLDSDTTLLANSDGKKALRDIVQFVPMPDFRQKTAGHLACEILAEIPEQFLSYMQAKKIKPGQRKLAQEPLERHDVAVPSLEGKLRGKDTVYSRKSTVRPVEVPKVPKTLLQAAGSQGRMADMNMMDRHSRAFSAEADDIGCCGCWGGGGGSARGRGRKGGRDGIRRGKARNYHPEQELPEVAVATLRNRRPSRTPTPTSTRRISLTEATSNDAMDSKLSMEKAREAQSVRLMGNLKSDPRLKGKEEPGKGVTPGAGGEEGGSSGGERAVKAGTGGPARAPGETPEAGVQGGSGSPELQVSPTLPRSLFSGLSPGSAGHPSPLAPRGSK